MTLVDTDIMVDVLRGFSPALKWFYELDDMIALPGYVAMELIQGCMNRDQLSIVERFLSNIKILWSSSSGCNTALNLFAKYHLKNRLGFIDVLIAQIAIEHHLPLYTFNTKHYKAISDLEIIQPYNK